MKIAASSSAAKRRARNLRKLEHTAKQRRNQPSLSLDELDQLTPIHRRAAGIDVGSAENYVAIPVASLAEGEKAVRTFGVFSAEQDALVEWLQKHQITTVAMESTGVYWLSLYDKLEAAGIEVYLVDAHAVKAVPGRKSDRIDCRWLQKLHTYGLLAKAFRPDPPIRRLRALTRQRAELVQCGVVHEHHMNKALVCMNLHLSLAIRNLVGETGLRVIQAILDGERDPKALVKLRDRRCKKSTPAEMEAALTGSYDEEQLFILRQSFDGWQFYQNQLSECDKRIEQVLASIPKATPKVQLSAQQKANVASVAHVPKDAQAGATQKQKPTPSLDLLARQSLRGEDRTPARATKQPKRPLQGNNAPTIDFTQALVRICGVDLMKICGLNLLSVLMLIGEIGVDMSRWRSARAFCSWLGLCPGTNISGGKVLSRRTRKVNNRASWILRLAARAAGKTDTWIGRFYRRIKARRGPAKAVTATARKLACVIYHLLTYQEEFTLLDNSEYEQQVEEFRLKRLRKEAKAMGYQLIETEAAERALASIPA
jgi:transposase